MGFVGVLEIALQCFDVLAWPLLALVSLVYPLCCSIRAIENNSISDTLKLNTYWVVFSLSLLFEHTFLKLLQWLPLWPYIRIMIVFLLVIPHFDGAFNVYKNLIYPCLTMDPQIVFNWFNKRRKESFFIRENLLAEVERYVKENGPEAVEKIVACKVREEAPNITGTGNNKFTAMENIKEKSIEVATDREFLKIIPPLKKVQKEWTSASSQVRTEKDTTFNSHQYSQNLKAAYDALELKNQANRKLAQIENRTSGTVEAKVKAVEVPTGREVHGSAEEVHKEWSRALCEVTTSSEATLNYHLAGKHEASYEEALYEELKVENQAYVTKTTPASVAKKSDKHEEPVNWTPGSGSKPKIIIKGKVQGRENTIPASITNGPHKTKEEPAEGVSSNGQKRKIIIHLKEKVQGWQENPNEVPRTKDYGLWCEICGVRFPGKIDLACHILGKKHKENVQEQQRNANSVLRKNDPPFWCKICDVRCYSEHDMACHLNGRRHADNLNLSTGW